MGVWTGFFHFFSGDKLGHRVKSECGRFVVCTICVCKELGSACGDSGCGVAGERGGRAGTVVLFYKRGGDTSGEKGGDPPLGRELLSKRASNLFTCVL